MKLKFLLTFILILGFKVEIYSQIKLAGKTSEANETNVLSNVNISVSNSHYRTISNEEGEFEILLDKLPCVLVFSHIGYQKIEIKVSNNDFLKVVLEPLPINLPEFKTENPARQYLKLARNKILEQSDEKYYFDGYFRKTSQVNKNIFGFYEVFFEAKASNLGMKEWLPKKARFAELNDSQIESTRFSPQVSFSKCFLLSSNNYFPINVNGLSEDYNYSVKNISILDEKIEIVEILFEPKNRNIYNFEGQISINLKTNNVLKIVGHLAINSQSSLSKNHSQKYELNFIEQNGISKFSSLNLIEKQKIRGKYIIETSLIHANDYLKSEPQENLIGIKEFFKSKINLKYDALFWNSAQVVKYTKMQKELISKFEKSKSFSSNFIE